MIKDSAHHLIEAKRQEMIKLAEDLGYTSNAAVKASQELDILLNNMTPRVHTFYIALEEDQQLEW